MKFSQLSTGQHFNYKHSLYVKNSALIAVNSKTGSNKFFKLSDVVTLVATAAADVSTDKSAPLNEAMLASVDVMQAFDETLGELKKQFTDADTSQIKTIDQRIKQCRESFLKRLNQTTE